MAKEKTGYVAIHRKLQDNFLWTEFREFSKAEAWIDIIMEVQHSEKPIKVMIKNVLLTCNYGESLKSINTWAERWNWSKSKVHRFLDMLQREKMVVKRSEKKTTRLIVCKYSTYDAKRYKVGTQVKRKRNASETQVETDKNGNNVDKGKKEKKKKCFDHIYLEEAEYDKLVLLFGKDGARKRLESLNYHIGSKGTKYKSHYMTILSWERRENPDFSVDQTTKPKGPTKLEILRKKEQAERKQRDKEQGYE